MKTDPRAEAYCKQGFFSAVVFATGLGVLYLTVIATVTVIPLRGQPLLDRWIGYAGEAGGKSGSLIRFRDVERFRDLDVLFLGSSHAYRLFDTRVFEEAGLKAFNLGSVAQTPLNSFYLLEQYFGRLRPKTVVMECYPMMLQSEDGLESFMDLVVNIPLGSALVRMAVATESPQAMHLLVSEWMRRRIRPFGDRQQQNYPNHAYVTGGYVEAHGVWQPRTDFKSERVFLAERQLIYVRKIAEFCKKNGSRMVLVLQPMPPAHLAAVTNYASALQRLQAAADQAGIELIDYNQIPVPLEDFAEEHTLNAGGAAKISRQLVVFLKASPKAAGAR